ncbi:MAG: toll/interleukin-1 receptor domain-containing protein, partial [Pedobacter sp.]
LAHSRFGIVVLSRSFISKKWTKAELDGLFSRELEEGNVILPVRHGLTVEEVTANFPTISGKLSLSSEEGVRSIAKKALDLIRPPELE